MEPRYVTKRLIPTESGGFGNGMKTSSSLAGGWQVHDRFEDISMPKVFRGQAEAEKECHLLNTGPGRLVLKSWNRSLEELRGSLTVDMDGREVLKGLTREESKRYVELMKLDVSDEFIALDRKHREARTGVKDEPY